MKERLTAGLFGSRYEIGKCINCEHGHVSTLIGYQRRIAPVELEISRGWEALRVDYFVGFILW